MPFIRDTSWPGFYCLNHPNGGAACEKVRSTENDQSNANMRMCLFVRLS